MKTINQLEMIGVLQKRTLLWGRSKQLKNDLLARKANSFFLLTNGPLSTFIISHQLDCSYVKLRSL